jgi:hypothetical protein
MTLLLLAVMQQICASDRRGFILGFQLGPSVSFIHSEDPDGDTYDNTILGAGFDFRIGWAPSNQFSVHYIHKAAIFLGEIGKKDPSAEQTLLAMVLFPLLPFSIGQNNAGVGLTYYFRPEVPSLFLDAQLGLSVYPLEGFLELSGGGGFAVGCGYEFSSHWSALGSVLVGFDSGENDTTSSMAVSVIATVGYLLY